MKKKAKKLCESIQFCKTFFFDKKQKICVKMFSN